MGLNQVFLEGIKGFLNFRALQPLIETEGFDYRNLNNSSVKLEKSKLETIRFFFTKNDPIKNYVTQIRSDPSICNL